MFTAAETEIYEWHDGTKARKSDPLALRRALVVAAGGDLSGASRAAIPPPLPEGCRLEPEQALAIEAAEDRLAGIVADGFGVKRFDPETGEGLTEAALMRLWGDWCAWMEKKSAKPAS